MHHSTFIILSPSYNEKSGGTIALHKLCFEINQLGHKAYLFPYFPGAPCDTEDPALFQHNMELTKQLLPAYMVNSAFCSEVLGTENLDLIAQREDIVVVYPEIISGNPLKGRKVVRWLLHDAGHFTGKVYFRTGEIYFRYYHNTKQVYIPGSRMSDSLLTTTHIPFEHYNLQGVAEIRSGTAFCVRKGKGKTLQHNLEDSILIDSLPHRKVAEIFKKVKHFISYDSRTLYSQLAVLCGCDSIVIPDTGVSEEEWMPDPEARSGLAYGFENLEKARLSAPDTLRLLRRVEDNSSKSTQNFITEVEAYFASR